MPIVEELSKTKKMVIEVLGMKPKSVSDVTWVGVEIVLMVGLGAGFLTL